jgi:hypothetical protein
MRKTINKKGVKKVTTKVVAPKVKQEEKKEFRVVMKFNNQEHDFVTDNLEASILEIKPTFLKTKLLIKIEKDGKVADRQFQGMQGKRFFNSKSFLHFFLSKLAFK